MQKLLACFVFLVACTDTSVDSNEQARRAYLGLDKSIGESINLGFAGFNAAKSANISTQMQAGIASGMLAINGQVDQGTSPNKTMRLTVGMVGYSDGNIVYDDKGDSLSVKYDTSTDTTMQPQLQLDLMGIPTGTVHGTLTGTYQLSGDLKGDVILDLTLDGHLMAGPNNTVERVAGSTTVTGTAMQGNGTYDVSVTL